MDITTVNDRHLYEARVLVRDRGTPDGQAALAGRVIRFGPPGWLTVVDPLTDDADVELYPMTRVLAVTHLREYGGAALHSSADH